MSFEVLIFTAFSQGFLGSLHCVAMCGPFVLLLNQNHSSGKVKFSRVISRNLIYQIAKIISYMGIGYLVGLMGKSLELTRISNLAVYAGSVVILLLALPYLLPVSWMARVKKSFRRLRFQSGLMSLVAKIAKFPGGIFWLPLAMGLVSGLLPCGLLYSAYALSLMAEGVNKSSLVMLAFSLGMLPALLILGLVSDRLRLWLAENIKTQHWRIIFGVFLLIIGFAAIFMRVSVDHSGHGHHKMQHEKNVPGTDHSNHPHQH